MRAGRSWMWIAALAGDAAAVLLFVALGRRAHAEGEGVARLAGTAAPFLLGLVTGWLVGLARRLHPWRPGFGVWAWTGTVVVGMLLRRFAFGQGTAAAFVGVAAVVTGLLLLGWRAVRLALFARPS